MGNAVAMMKGYKENSLSVKKASSLNEEELKNKIIVGELVDKDLPELTEQIERVRRGLCARRKKLR